MDHRRPFALRGWLDRLSRFAPSVEYSFSAGSQFLNAQSNKALQLTTRQHASQVIFLIKSDADGAAAEGQRYVLFGGKRFA
jgi:hypothetical protein